MFSYIVFRRIGTTRIGSTRIDNGTGLDVDRVIGEGLWNVFQYRCRDEHLLETRYSIGQPGPTRLVEFCKNIIQDQHRVSAGRISAK